MNDYTAQCQLANTVMRSAARVYGAVERFPKHDKYQSAMVLTSPFPAHDEVGCALARSRVPLHMGEALVFKVRLLGRNYVEDEQWRDFWMAFTLNPTAYVYPLWYVRSGWEGTVIEWGRVGGKDKSYQVIIGTVKHEREVVPEHVEGFRTVVLSHDLHCVHVTLGEHTTSLRKAQLFDDSLLDPTQRIYPLLYCESSSVELRW